MAPPFGRPPRARTSRLLSLPRFRNGAPTGLRLRDFIPQWRRTDEIPCCCLVFATRREASARMTPRCFHQRRAKTLHLNTALIRGLLYQLSAIVFVGAPGAG